MSYEKDLEYLSRELRNAQNTYDEAEEDERESDAEMWMNRVTHLEFQIEVFEKATKSDEYEAKAKAFDFIKEARKEVLTDVRERGLKLPMKPIAKEHMCEECYTEHCQWLRELSAPKQDGDQWYTLYESKA